MGNEVAAAVVHGNVTKTNNSFAHDDQGDNPGQQNRAPRCPL